MADRGTARSSMGAGWHPTPGQPPPEDTFAWAWEPWWLQERAYLDDVRWLREVVERRPLVDLGGGRACLARPLADALHCASYIGVDRFHAPQMAPCAWHDRHEDLPELGAPTAPSRVPVARVVADAVDFASQCVPGSALFVVGGLDRDVVSSTAWHEALAVALARCVMAGGAVLVTESSCGDWLEGAGLVRCEGLRWMRERARLDARDGGKWLGTAVYVAPGVERVGASR